uniref:Endo/exonuclease/phosphatase domain-containing protein n=1 Tax=Rhabditophanes sp. KR3021 TaxID=114890 RepID=A0AC35UFR8_9BILA
MAVLIKKIDSLNARTLGNDDNLLLLSRELDAMDIDVLAITETRRHPEAFVYASCDVGYFSRFDKIGGIGFLIKGDLA